MASKYTLAYACTTCRRSFKRPGGAAAPRERVCPHCGGTAKEMGRHFKAPRATDLDQWEKVRFLIENGFPFHRIYDKRRGGGIVAYPKTLTEAKGFVRKYSDYAIRPNNQLQQTAQPTRRHLPTERRKKMKPIRVTTPQFQASLIRRLKLVFRDCEVEIAEGIHRSISFRLKDRHGRYRSNLVRIYRNLPHVLTRQSLLRAVRIAGEPKSGFPGCLQRTDA